MLRRAFASSVRLVEPRVAAADVAAGKAYLIDVRTPGPASDQVRPTLPHTRVAFESICGPDRAESALATAGEGGLNKKELLSKIDEAALGGPQYQATLRDALAVLSTRVGASGTLSAKDAQARVARVLAAVEEEGGAAALARSLAKEAKGEARVELEAAAKVLEGETTPLQEQFVGKVRDSLRSLLAADESASKETLAASRSLEQLAALSGDAFGNLEGSKRQAPAVPSTLPKDKPLYLLCLAGVRSTLAAERLATSGFSNVAVVEGGIDRWILQGCATTASGETDAELERHVSRGLASAPGGIAEINE
jgi:rhodanese-related sulfurtransferase